MKPQLAHLTTNPRHEACSSASRLNSSDSTASTYVDSLTVSWSSRCPREAFTENAISTSSQSASCVHSLVWTQTNTRCVWNTRCFWLPGAFLRAQDCHLQVPGVALRIHQSVCLVLRKLHAQHVQSASAGTEKDLAQARAMQS